MEFMVSLDVASEEYSLHEISQKLGREGSAGSDERSEARWLTRTDQGQACPPMGFFRVPFETAYD